MWMGEDEVTKKNQTKKNKKKGDCPKTVLNAINVTYERNVLSVIQAKIWPKKHVIQTW
jgi:hypothetical protein